MSPAESVQYFARASDKLKRGSFHAEQQTRDDARKAADVQSAGKATPQQLAKAGHPFAAARPSTGYNAAVINQGKGVFAVSWKSQGPLTLSGALVVRVWNTDPNAKFFGGTRTTVPRPVRLAIIFAVAPFRRRRLLQVVSDSLKP